MGRHVALAGTPATMPFGAVNNPGRPEPRSHASHTSFTTGSLTRAGIAAALVTASAAAVAGSTGAFPALTDSLSDSTDVSQAATLLSAQSPASVPAPRAATVAPVSLAAAPAAAAPAVKSESPAQKAAAAQAKEKAAEAQKAASAKKEKAAAAPASLGALGDRIVAQAAEFKGVPYEWGGTTPSGFDCSGLTKYVFGKMGISLPRTSQAQYDKAEHISQSQAQPGDLVFMGGENSIYHVAIYAGDGKMWTAPETGQSVKLGNLFGDYHFGRIR
ncbi:C40 family peptidase [Actinomycetospora termitidis]|uniref:C40 family peptidase n=1 Tax=Actinomycetospora termitidis TaxID=3053470 RepID=A0ABT7MFR5_9PSEU|nr:C40 family peptidase [Actinomycetospora sp. Odt1-22]MDL5159518.1 C40 family peptidase [Actinomycetospora sp. Odt1-22]